MPPDIINAFESGMTEKMGHVITVRNQTSGAAGLADFAHEQPLLVQNADTSLNVKQRPVSTPEQIRLWRQRELNRMFHGDKKELEPVSQIMFKNTIKPATDLALPSRPLMPDHQDWFIVIALMSIVILASVRHTFGNYLSVLFQSIFNYSTAGRMFRERNISLSQGEIRLELFSYLVFGLLFYQASNQFNFNVPYSGFIQFMVSLAGVLLFFVGKKFLYIVAGLLIENRAETAEFVYNFSNHIRVAGILALPFTAAIAWAPYQTAYPLYISGLTIFSILYLFMLWRGLKIFLKKQFSIFYLFLYLCTLEILPLLLVIKLISG